MRFDIPPSPKNTGLVTENMSFYCRSNATYTSKLIHSSCFGAMYLVNDDIITSAMALPMLLICSCLFTANQLSDSSDVVETPSNTRDST